MTDPRTPKPDDPAQYKPVRDLAAELEAEADDKAVSEGVKRLAVQKRQPKPRQTKPRQAKPRGTKRRKHPLA